VRMVWPPQSPDLNPIESIWDYVDCRLRKSSRTSKDHMWTNLRHTWNSIPKKILRKYIFSMRNRCEAVIRAKGGHTSY
jgi:transposase